MLRIKPIRLKTKNAIFILPKIQYPKKLYDITHKLPHFNKPKLEITYEVDSQRNVVYISREKPPSFNTKL